MDERLVRLARGLSLYVAAVTPAAAATVFQASFDEGPDGFVYRDDAFLGTAQPDYASGAWLPSGGFDRGGLEVAVGGIDALPVSGMSGGWGRSFALPAATELELTLRYKLTQTAEYADTEISQVLVGLNGGLRGIGRSPLVAEIKGDGPGGAPRGTGWRAARIDLGTLPAGEHELVIGAYNNHKDAPDKSTAVIIDDVRVGSPGGPIHDPSAAAIVRRLDPARFRQDIVSLAGFGTRHWSQQGNLDAAQWIEARLSSLGYAVERHTYPYAGHLRDNIYATKIGEQNPDRMYIVSAHLDSINISTSDQAFAPGADDDASGCALVLEAARVFAPPDVRTRDSIRFIFWNNEETLLSGSQAYVARRRALQGVEHPPDSGLYPEPIWLGIIQHDMILYDHGLPPRAEQIAEADIDIEYQSGALFVGEAIELATALHEANIAHASDYPGEISPDMNWTDSKSFQSDCPAISVRENRRIAEIGPGSNPHWHRATDVVDSYSAADFLLGFNAVQTTVGAVARLAGAQVVVCGDGIVAPAEPCDDANTDPGDGCDGACRIESGWTCAREPSTCAVCRPDGLSFASASAPTTRLSWRHPSPGVCPSRFDVARGGLGSIPGAGGFGAAVCLADDCPDLEWDDPEAPSPGMGFWYLVRVDGDSWDSLERTGAADRDSALVACP